MRILVVDDQPNIVDMLATVLRFHGFVVNTAGTAAEALVRAAEYPPDLILLDVMLPDGDGREVCRRLRAGGSEAGVVFLTARDARDDLIAGLAYGGDDWITKPFDVDVLLARVRAVLRTAWVAGRCGLRRAMGRLRGWAPGHGSRWSVWGWGLG